MSYIENLSKDFSENLSLYGSYIFEDERGICPQIEYCFDLELPSDFIPVGSDGEVDSFQLVSISEQSDSE
ncbi:unnamed protein product [Trichobilharzia regenti]|nr:unnamed protein product [Trichobilharzia regenti]